MLVVTDLIYLWTDLIYLWTDMNYNDSTRQPADVYKLTAIGLGILMMLLGNAMPKASRNTLFGLRTVWSMKNDRVWQKSQRFGGYASVVFGFLMVLSGIFFSQIVYLPLSVE